MNNEKEVILSATDKANKRELSMEEAKDIVDKYPKSHRAHALLAFMHLQKRDFQKTLKTLSESLKYGKSVTVYNLLAQTNIELGKKDKAKDYFDEALKLDSNDYQTLVNLLSYYGKNGEFQEGQIILKKMILINPNDTELKSKLISMYLRTSSHEEALDYLKLLIKEEPQRFVWRHLQGNVFYQFNKKEEGLESYLKALEIMPNSVRTLFNISVYYNEKKLYDDAISYLKKAIEADPDFTQSYQQMLFMLYKKFDITSFKSFYSKHKEKLRRDISASAICELVDFQEEEKSSHPFCPNPMSMITKFHIKDFDKDHEAIIGKLKEFLNDLEYLEGHALHSGKSQINGQQTSGNIFNRDEKIIGELNDIFKRAITDYRHKHQSLNNVLIQEFPNDFKLFGWTTRFSLGSGHHFRHMHPGGWISGSFYTDVPADLKKGEGSIEFGLEGDNLPIYNKKVKIPRMRIEPKEGSFIIFPSSLFHGTTPFTSDDKRQAINFDLMPE